MNCICGCANYENLKCDGFEVNSLGELVSVELNLVRCTNCGIIRQLSFKNDREYLDYYQKKYPPNVNDYYIKNYKHDRELARKRFDDYELRRGMKLLDIGSGSGAFVDEARSHGLQAFGCELANYHYAKSNEHIYCGQFEKLNFPTDYFDVIVYTGFNYAGRNLLMTRASDAVIVICGRIGTLNEFTIAFEDNKPIGVLIGTGGTADLIREVIKRGHRGPGKVVYSKDPKELVEKLLILVKKEKKVITPL